MGDDRFLAASSYECPQALDGIHSCLRLREVLRYEGPSSSPRGREIVGQTHKEIGPSSKSNPPKKPVSISHRESQTPCLPNYVVRRNVEEGLPSGHGNLSLARPIC